ncbi:hypothetical protein [Brevundimonas sp.]|uniref:hypothetical protein n=1 Tax=Brevundimonas sp. TaxID=1871086 RepID=UPI0035652E85
MLTLSDRDAVTAALTDLTLDPVLRALITLRAWQIDTDRNNPLSDVLQIVVVHPGDPPEVILKAVSFPIILDRADQPGFEWMEDHGSWFELAYVLTDEAGMLVFVPDHPDTDPSLHAYCLKFAGRSVISTN